MAGRPGSGPLVKGELEQILRRLAPQIASLFQEHGASEAEARRLLEETLATFSRNWRRIVNRERWLLRQLTAALEAARK